MNLFTKSNGESIEATTSYENSGIQAIIPDGSQLHANILEATWEEKTQHANQLIKITWYITDKGAYNSFLINQKLHLNDSKASKADKAKEMLATIDANCKGALMKLAAAGKLVEGDNMQLARALNGGSALLTVAEYSMKRDDGTEMVGNWVRAVSPVAKKQAQEDKAIMDKAPEESFDDLDDDGLIF
jgi:hypothetical protein